MREVNLGHWDPVGSRHWDPAGKYMGAVLRAYEYWVLEVSWLQHTLGSFIVFCRRPGVRLMSELNTTELAELKWAMADMESALRRHPVFCPDHFNYLQMGNALPLLHFHGIPRYETERAFCGKVWKDVNPRRPPTWVSEEVSSEIVVKMRDLLIPLLPAQG